MSEILVLNGHCLGEYCRVSSIPKTGATVVATGRKAVEDGGKGTNAAIAIGRLGGDVGFIGKCGNDTGGKLGAKWMSEAHVDLTHYILSDDVNTIVSLVVVADNGDNIIINFVDDDDFITAAEVDCALEASTDARFLIAGFELPWETVLHGCQTAHRLGLFTILNPSPLTDDMRLGNLSYIDLLIVNETETQKLLGREVKDWKTASSELRDKFHSKMVIITLGESGSVACEGSDFVEVPARRIKAVDTVGAGDGYVAALTYRISEGDSLEQAMQFASGFSAYVCSFTGTVGVYPTPPQLEAFLKTLS